MASFYQTRGVTLMYQHHAAFPCYFLPRPAPRCGLRTGRAFSITKSSAGCLSEDNRISKYKILEACSAVVMLNIVRQYLLAIWRELLCARFGTIIRRVCLWFHNATPKRNCPPYNPRLEQRPASATEKSCPVHSLRFSLFFTFLGRGSQLSDSSYRRAVVVWSRVVD
jgi:hypothetical protein